MLLRKIAISVVIGVWLCVMHVNLTMAATKANQDHVQVSRYLNADVKPTRAQVNPLLAVVSVRFPLSITTIEEAMNYLLRFSSYALIPQNDRSLSEKQMLKQPLPLVDREFRAIRLQEALVVLAGQSAFTLVQDPIHRLVHFRLTKQAKPLWGDAYE